MSDEEGAEGSFAQFNTAEQDGEMLIPKNNPRAPRWQTREPPGIVDKITGSRPVQFISNFFGSSPRTNPAEQTNEETGHGIADEENPANRRAKRITCACACVIILIALVLFIVFIVVSRSLYGQEEAKP